MTRPKIAAVPSVEDARAKLLELQEKRDAAVDRKEKLVRDREMLALAALSDGDAGAQAALDQATGESAQADLALQNIYAAMKAAEARLAAAEIENAAHAERQRAVQVKEIIAERQQITDEVVRAIDALAKAAEDLILSGRKLREVSGRHTHPQADNFAIGESLKTALLPLSSRGILRMPPPDRAMRKPLVELVTIADAIHNGWATDVLTGPKAQLKRAAPA